VASYSSMAESRLLRRHSPAHLRSWVSLAGHPCDACVAACCARPACSRRAGISLAGNPCDACVAPCGAFCSSCAEGERCLPRQAISCDGSVWKNLRSDARAGCQPRGWQSKSLGSEAEVTRAAVACLHLHYVPDNTGPPNAFNSAMNLTTSRLILKPWRDADLSAFARLNDDSSPIVKSRLRRF
jgi:hypothetical protein